MHDASSRPRHTRPWVGADVVRRIVKARLRFRRGPHFLGPRARRDRRPFALGIRRSLRGRIRPDDRGLHTTGDRLLRRRGRRCAADPDRQRLGVSVWRLRRTTEQTRYLDARDATLWPPDQRQAEWSWVQGVAMGGGVGRPRRPLLTFGFRRGGGAALNSRHGDGVQVSRAAGPVAGAANPRGSRPTAPPPPASD